MGKRKNERYSDDPIGYLKKRVAVGSNLGCWEWTRAKNARGYGVLRRGPEGNALAHRASYEQFVGPLRDGQLLRHKCDNPSCINPAHLEPGSASSNSLDMVSRGRSKTGSSHWKSLLCEPDVLEIKQRIRSGEDRCAIADLFGVSGPAISDIARGATWGHV